MFNLAISSAPTTAIMRTPYYDLQTTLTVMKSLLKDRAVDGFEVQHLAEWSKEHPPRDDVTGDRRIAWEKSLKYTTEDLLSHLEGLPVFSVHANRDVGILLCGNSQDQKKGKEMVEQSLVLAETLQAGVCVFHLWDTWKRNLDMAALGKWLGEVTPSFAVKASVENVPTHIESTTPRGLVEHFEWITLDMRWAAKYNELKAFESVRDRIINVHLRGTLENAAWVLNNSPFGFWEALDTIESWGYSGLVTMEPEGGLSSGNWEDLVTAMLSIRKYLE
ncbi:MAG: hypothetical protein HXS41_09270 [Theionarchaea archaeon]|nr:hypothetical protein [Theionarchaea archaeon]MBU7000395.1 hypothetical protein [Theionarchaea archaeon]MBU7021237.1 hypothetical protein [Theionarchaea archaeon]MBU7036009.1 hypothetical protein [Theionarchaea archaeon]MBU7039729.1 hypothetical protein [Theionarchaea archaeon]